MLTPERVRQSSSLSRCILLTVNMAASKATKGVNSWRMRGMRGRYTLTTSGVSPQNPLAWKSTAMCPETSMTRYSPTRVP